MSRPFFTLPIRLSLYALLMVGTWALLKQRSIRHEPGIPSPVQAIGDVSKLSELERTTFAPDPEFFPAMRTPGPLDWLSLHQEEGQTFDEYSGMLGEVTPKPGRRQLCLLPLGEFDPASAPSLNLLRDYCEAFFGMDTRVLDAVPLRDVPVTRRTLKGTQIEQLQATEVLQWLSGRKPAECYAVLAVTMQDLYPEEGWNFVFGLGNLLGGTGVFSFARYDPAFLGEPVDKDTRQVVLTRSLKVLSHEMTHMFGLQHCIFFDCDMNGSNSLAETDASPLHLCPVCLRKLHASTGFDLIGRERHLLAFYESNQFTKESEWTRRRLKRLEHASARQP